MKGRAFAFMAIVLLVACAQVREITGGDADAKGPQLTGSEPPNNTTRFSGDRIVLHFDERVQVERARERLLVSPPLDEPPTVRVLNAKDVEIELNAPLRANTTYTFSMGEMVKDLTEGNSGAGIDYVLGTGDVLDSLMVIGKVTNAFSTLREKDVLVMLHDAGDTANFRNSRPVYATRTDTAGTFALRHIRAGTYLITALKDQNNNYRYDLPNEEVAFGTGPVNAKAVDEAAPIILRTFQERSEVQALRDAMVMADGAWRFVFARAVQQLELTDVARSGGMLSWTREWNSGRDTLILWPSDTTALNQGRYAIAADREVLDTLSYRSVLKWPFFTALITQVREDDDGVALHFEATRPIAAIDRDRFLLVKDSLPVAFDLVQDSADLRHFILRPELPPGANATLTIVPKAVRDIYQGHNDTLRIGIGRAAEARTGTLRVSLEVGTPGVGAWILQLLDGQGRTVREATLDPASPAVVWERITPGNHGLRLIEDASGNGRWDPGIWLIGLQPERVWRYAEVLNVRAAWDLGITWKPAGP